MDEVGVFEDRGSRRGFCVDREVGQQAALGVWEGTGDEVKRRQSNESIAEAAQPVDQDPFCRTCHCVTLVCLVRSPSGKGGEAR